MLEETYLDLVRRVARRLPQSRGAHGGGGGGGGPGGGGSGGGGPFRDSGLERSIAEKRDPKTGHAYYVDELTGRTAWRREELLAATAAAIPVITQDLRLQVRKRLLACFFLALSFSEPFY